MAVLPIPGAMQPPSWPSYTLILLCPLLQSMVKTDIWLMGLAALFTASKSENHPLPLDHFITVVSSPAHRALRNI